MTHTFEGQAFRHFRDRGSGRTFSDLIFRNCTFINSSLSLTTNPRRRSTIRNVTVTNSKTINCDVNCALIEDVLVENVQSNDFVGIWGAAFKHVTLRGSISHLKISSLIDGVVKPEQQRPFDDANLRYYQDVDWALDIREAECENIDLRGVPGRLVLRDPATQVLVTRQKAEAGHWRTLALSKTYWPEALELYLRESPWDAVVLAIPKRMKKSNYWTYQTLLDGLQVLRGEGIAEPD